MEDLQKWGKEKRAVYDQMLLNEATRMKKAIDAQAPLPGNFRLDFTPNVDSVSLLAKATNINAYLDGRQWKWNFFNPAHKNTGILSGPPGW